MLYFIDLGIPIPQRTGDRESQARYILSDSEAEFVYSQLCHNYDAGSIPRARSAALQQPQASHTSGQIAQLELHTQFLAAAAKTMSRTMLTGIAHQGESSSSSSSDGAPNASSAGDAGGVTGLGKAGGGDGHDSRSKQSPSQKQE